MIGRDHLLFLVVGLCVLNGLFSPYLAIAWQITPALMPEVFPKTAEWVLFFSSLVVSTATLLLSGIPAALFERFFETDERSTASMWIWLSTTTLMSLTALENIG